MRTDTTAGRVGWHGPNNNQVAAGGFANEPGPNKTWREKFKEYEQRRFGKTGVLSNGFSFRSRQKNGMTNAS